MLGVTNRVERGLISSYARPGGSVTGTSIEVQVGALAATEPVEAALEASLAGRPGEIQRN
jgi:hypothetical protein